MTDDHLRIIRPDDMLVFDLGTVNLDVDTVGARLTRRDAGADAVLLVRLPSQHTVEAVVGSPQDPPVAAFCAGPTVLPFLLPSGQDGLALSLPELLDWAGLSAAQVPTAIPPDEGEVSVFQGTPRIAIEFPTRLLLTYEGLMRWTHRAEPFTVNGWTELWHTSLTAPGGGSTALRAYAVTPGRPLRDVVVLRDRNLADLVALTSDQDADGTQPLQAERFTLTPLGASVRIQGAWDGLSVPGTTAAPVTQLTAYQQTTGLGRDQYLRVVDRGYLSTGHRASKIQIYERQFLDEGSGLVAGLRQNPYIAVQEPEVVYGDTVGYRFEGREMPFRSLRITNLVTPPLDSVPDGMFMPTVSGVPFPFTMIGTDAEGRQVSLAMPLMFVPFGTQGPDASQAYNEFDEAQRTVQLGGQSLAMAQPADGEPSSTCLPVTSLTFLLNLVSGHPLGALPILDTAVVRVPAVRMVTGGTGETTVSHDGGYLHQGIGSHPTGAYLRADTPVPVTFGAEQAGGLARPDMAIDTISSRAGAIPGAFAGAAGVDVHTLKELFKQAKLLGSITVGDIVGEIPLPGPDDLKQLTEEQIEQRLAAGDLKTPILRTGDVLAPPGTDGLPRVGSELRYLWTPPLNGGAGPLDLSEAALTLDARTVASPDAASQSVVRGELRDFTIDLAGAARMHIGSLSFTARPGRRPEVTAHGFDLQFRGALEFVNTLRDLLPADAFGGGAFVDVAPDGITAGYELAVPTSGVGVFALQNLRLSAALQIPFDDRPLSLRFAVSDRHHPFNLSISALGGGGFLSLVLNTHGVQLAEGALEFGGNLSVDLGVASGGLYAMGGVYFALGADGSVGITGYLRCGGYLSVLGIVSVTVEFYLGLTYHKNPDTKLSEVSGMGTVSVGVHVAFFSKTVSLSLERHFPGAAADPTFADCVTPADWDEYCLAYAE